MSDFRVFASAPVQGVIALSPGESHHLVIVNRAKVGEPVVAFDGHGTEWSCELVEARKNAALLKVTAAHTRAPLTCAITLAQSLPKGGVMDEIVRHATELGAAKIVPLITERTQVHLDGDRSDKKTDKWRIAALEAAKQCGNPFLPEISGIESLGSFLREDTVATAELRLIASLHKDARSLRTTLASFRSTNGRAPKSAVWLVGPEGDFSEAETEAALKAGFIPVTLGPLVLRCDTAATAALGILNHETAPE